MRLGEYAAPLREAGSIAEGFLGQPERRAGRAGLAAAARSGKAPLKLAA